jgi:hypothetical protein
MSEIVVVITGATGPPGSGNSGLDDLTDVTITAAASGDILRHNGTAWVDAVGTDHFDAAGAAASAQSAAEATAAGALSSHEADTTSVHGIADTSALLDSSDIGVSVQGYSAVLAATTASFTTADESKLDGIEAGATADMSAAEILAALITVDGAGSGLDADLLDGNSSAAFATAGHNHTGTYQPLDAQLTDVAGITPAKGSVVISDASNLKALAVGTDGQVLTADSAQSNGLKWAAAAGGDVATDAIFDAKGDLAVGTGADTAAKLTVGSSGQVAMVNSNALTGLSYASPLGARVFLSTAWIVPDTATAPDTGSTSAVTTETWYWPIHVPRRATLDAIQIQIDTAQAGSSVRVGIYSADASLAPVALVADYGSLATDTTGLKTATGSTALDPGWYCLATNVSNHSSLRPRRFNSSTSWTPLGVASAATGFFYTGYKATTLNDDSAGLPASPRANTPTVGGSANCAAVARFTAA